MRHVIRTGFWLAAAVLAALTGGCGTDARTEAIRFHDQVMVATSGLETADSVFMQSLIPVVRGESSGVDQINAAYQGCRHALSDAQNRVAQATVPDTTSARALEKTLKGFLEHQKKMIEGDFAQAVAMIANPKMDPTERLRRIRDMFVRVQDAEHDQIKALRTAQKAFAEEHHLGLREPRENQAFAFLTALGVANGRLELGGKQMGEALVPIFAEQAVQGDQVRKTLDRARATLATVRGMVDLLTPLPNKVAKELHEAEKAYLAKQGEIFDHFFPELVRIAHDPLLTPDTRKKRADAVLLQMQAAERDEMGRLTRARDEFLREYRLIRR